MSEDVSPEWTDGADTYGFPRWWAMEPGESMVVATYEFRDTDAYEFLVLDYNNIWRTKLGAQVRIRLAKDGTMLADLFVARELVGVVEYTDTMEPRDAIDAVLGEQTPIDDEGTVRYVRVV
jgi:hypothetical protein